MGNPLPHGSQATVLYFYRVDVFAALRQSARIARQEGFTGVAKRCEEMADQLQGADPSNPIVMVL